MRAADVWKTLGIKRTTDRAEIRRAYARALKQNNPEDDPEGFKTLRLAYEQALLRAAAPHQDQPGFEPGQIIVQTEDANSEPPFPASPEDNARAMLQQAVLKLEKLIKTSSTPDIQLSALDDVLQSPALDQIDTRNQIEQRLAQIILSHTPLSDALLTPVIDRFHWDKTRRSLKTNWQVQQVLKRYDDYRLLAELKKPSHPLHKPYKALSGAPVPITFKRRLQQPAPLEISDLLEHVRTKNPTLRHDLNPETVALWEAYFSKPRLPAWTLWSVLLTPVCILLIILVKFTLPDTWRGLHMLLSLPMIYALATLFYHYVYALPHHKWTHREPYALPVWMRFGWAPALIALLFSAAQPIPAVSYVVILAAVLTTLWVIVTGEPDKRESNVPWQLRAILGELYLIVWWLFLVWDQAYPYNIQMSAALLAAIAVSAFGRIPLFRQWIQWPSSWRRAGLIGLLLLTIGAAALVCMASAWPEWSMFAVAAVATVLILYKIPMLERGEVISGRLPYYLMICGIYLVRSMAAHLPVLLIGGIALLLWAAINIIAQIFARKET